MQFCLIIDYDRAFKVLFTRAFLKGSPQRQWMHLSGVYTGKKTVDTYCCECQFENIEINP
jgi:hypothetical protein